VEKDNIMVVGLISDLHLDFFIKKYQDVEQYFKTVLAKENTLDIDVLVIAGDMSHYNNLTINFVKKILEDDSEIEIILVAGNHDLYLVSSEQDKKYQGNSWGRIEELKKEFEKMERVHFLDGTQVIIKGVIFGGTMGWYNVTDFFAWISNSNDASYIRKSFRVERGNAPKVYYDTFALYQEELTKMQDLYCNVLITHIPFVNIPDELNTTFAGSSTNEYFMSDAFNFVKATNADYYLFGHVHERFDFIQDGVRCITNPVGYPYEFKEKRKDFQIKRIII
jgi:DNA repair exonuclease SbcCD nuclease subunit